MKLKDFVTIARNKTNKQTNLTLKKTVLKNKNISEEDILDVEISRCLRIK